MYETNFVLGKQNVENKNALFIWIHHISYYYITIVKDLNGPLWEVFFSKRPTYIHITRIFHLCHSLWIGLVLWWNIDRVIVAQRVGGTELYTEHCAHTKKSLHNLLYILQYYIRVYRLCVVVIYYNIILIVKITSTDELVSRFTRSILIYYIIISQ